MAETLGGRLRELRSRAGLTQGELAARSGVLVGTVRNWEQDQRSPAALLTLYRLAKALELPMERFVEGLEDSGGAEKLPGSAPAKRARGKRQG
jgi:transcriptional regulator with XRE-family HTH domain